MSSNRLADFFIFIFVLELAMVVFEDYFPIPTISNKCNTNEEPEWDFNNPYTL